MRAAERRSPTPAPPSSRAPGRRLGHGPRRRPAPRAGTRGGRRCRLRGRPTVTGRSGRARPPLRRWRPRRRAEARSRWSTSPSKRPSRQSGRPAHVDSTCRLLRPKASPRPPTPAPRCPPCRFCAAPLRHTFVDLGMSPLCESYVPAERVNAMEPFYPLHAKVCESCLLVQLEEFVTAEDIFTRVRVLLLVLGLLGRARPRVRRDGDRALRPRPGQPRHGGRQQRRLPAAPRRRARHPGARHRARGQRRRGGARARDRDDRAVLRPRARRRARRRGPPRRPARRQQRDGARAGPQRLRRRLRDGARAARAS